MGNYAHYLGVDFVTRDVRELRTDFITINRMVIRLDSYSKESEEYVGQNTSKKHTRRAKN